MKKRVTLPDLDDDAAFQLKMRPLAESILPNDRKSGRPEERTFERTDCRVSGVVGAAHELERIELIRGAKKRFEYLIPERVGRALAIDAAARGVSATTKLLQVLRDAGYPVIEEDLLDLRKLPKR